MGISHGNWGWWQGQRGGFLYPLLGWDAPSLGHAHIGPTGISKMWWLLVAAQDTEGWEVEGTGSHTCHPNQPSHLSPCLVRTQDPPVPCQEDR